MVSLLYFYKEKGERKVEKLKKALMVLVVLLAVSMLASQVSTYTPPPAKIPPIVSTSWLKSNIGLTNLVVLDIRDPASYNAGHIPGAINVPADKWYANPPFGPTTPWMEMPSKNDLFKVIGDAGITKDSLVVVVGSTSGLILPEAPLALYGTATITRVAITLLYAGVENVAILDGGYDKWAYEGKPVSKVAVTPKPVTYTGTIDETMIASASYVESKIGKSVIVDARDEIVYLGVVNEPWGAYPGHIPKAKSLPTPTLWNIKSVDPTQAIYVTYKTSFYLYNCKISRVVGEDKSREIIVYCGVGGYASTVYYLLRAVFGYTNVKMYDGSYQEWTALGKPVELG
jgi:thiosulfate/3-mercaptopyruvate sulfurtransferase